MFSPSGEKLSIAVEAFVTTVTKLSPGAAKTSTAGTRASTVGEKVSLSGEKRFLVKNRRKNVLKTKFNRTEVKNMAKVQVKRIKKKVLKILNAWNELAPSVLKFRKTKKEDFEAGIADAQAVENEIEDLEVRLKAKKAERDSMYTSLEDDGVDIRRGVDGHEDFGADSQLYGAMGFVRESEKKSGLTHKTKNRGENK